MYAQGKRADLREMYAEWPFFQSTIDLIEMILAKADMRIAELYDATLVTDPAHRRLGAHLRQHFHSTVDAVLQASCLLSALNERFRLPPKNNWFEMQGLRTSTLVFAGH